MRSIPCVYITVVRRMKIIRVVLKNICAHKYVIRTCLYGGECREGIEPRRTPVIASLGFEEVCGVSGFTHQRRPQHDPPDAYILAGAVLSVGYCPAAMER